MANRSLEEEGGVITMTNPSMEKDVINQTTADVKNEKQKPAELMDLPVEAKVMIFKALQAITSGPRYLIHPQNLAGETPEEVNCKMFKTRAPHLYKVEARDLDTGMPTKRLKLGFHPDGEKHAYKWSSGDDIRLCWKLIDPGALYLASTCRELWDIYTSSTIVCTIAVVLEIPEADPGLSDDQLDKVWGYWTYSLSVSTLCDQSSLQHFYERDERRHGLLKRLRRFKEGLRGCPMTRFVLDCRLESLRTEIICNMILRGVNEVFGHELLVVVVCWGNKGHQQFEKLVPRKARYFEAFENALLFERENWDRQLNTRISGAELVKTESSASYESCTDVNEVDGDGPKRHRHPKTDDRSTPPPGVDGLPLSLHLHVSVSAGLELVDIAAMAVGVFGFRAVRRFYYSYVHPHGDPVSENGGRGGVDRSLLYELSDRKYKITSTLEDLTLDARFIWEDIESNLPMFRNLKTLDLELVRFYPDTDERKPAMLTWLRENCVDSEGNVMTFVGDGDEGTKTCNILPQSLMSATDRTELTIEAEVEQSCILAAELRKRRSLREE